MKHLLLFLVTSVLIPIAFVSATKPLPSREFADWEWRAEISTGTDTKSGFFVLELPVELFSRLKPDLSDLRVGKSINQEVPYVLSVERESDTSARVPAKVFNLSSVRGEATSFIVDMGQPGVFHNAIRIGTPSENFRRIVEIQGSDDERSWRTLNPKGQIYDYSVRDVKPLFVRDTEVSYPDTTFRYLKVSIFDYGEAPLKVTGAEVFRRVLTGAREIAYTPAIEIQDNAKDRTTDIIADLGARGIPHRRASLAVPDTNFHRAVAVYESDDKDKNEWQLLTHAYIFRIRTEKFDGRNLEFIYPESNKRYLKLSVLNYDDSPLTVRGVTLFGVVRRILFQYDTGGGTYYVYAGNSDAKRPQYDLERISPYVDTATLDRATVLPVERNPFFEPKEPKKPPLTERSPYVLPTILGVAVAMLAFILLRLVANVWKQQRSQ